MQQMAGIKELLMQSAHRIAFDTRLSVWLAQRQQARRVIMLHGVGGPDMPARDFENLVRWLQETYRVIPLETLLSNFESGIPIDPIGEVALTFDDGLRNLLRYASPVLRQFRVPATFFVCPGLIESRQWLWNHEARSRLKRLDKPVFSSLAESLAAPEGGVESMIAWMKTLPLAKRKAVELRIREATTDFVPSAEEVDRFAPLAWEDFSQLDPALITIGSHTLSHPILPTLDDAELHRELRESRTMLEERLGRTVDLFCYPNGSSDARVYDAARQVYRAAVTTQEGLVGRDVDRIAIPRIPVSSSLPLLAWRMYRPTA